MRMMSKDELKKRMKSMAKYMPDDLAREFVQFVADFYGRWVARAAEVAGGGDDAEIPVGFFPWFVQASLVAAVTELAKGMDPTAWVVTLQEALVRTGMVAGTVDFRRFLRSEPVVFLSKMLRQTYRDDKGKLGGRDG